MLMARLAMLGRGAGSWAARHKGDRRDEPSRNVPAAVDLEQARQRLLEVAARTPSALHDPPPAVFVDNVAAGAMVLNLRV